MWMGNENENKEQKKKKTTKNETMLRVHWFLYEKLNGILGKSPKHVGLSELLLS